MNIGWMFSENIYCSGHEVSIELYFVLMEKALEAEQQFGGAWKVVRCI